MLFRSHYFAYAQWPSERAWAAQPEPTARMVELRNRMREFAELVDGPLRGDVVADLEVEREDFAKNTDVVPVSDPHIFSETQRMAQMQAVLALADKHPDQFNMNQVLSRTLKQLKVPNINELMKDVPAPEQRTSADENAALLIGQPAYAYIQQDHIAHIQDHLDRKSTRLNSSHT